VEHFLDAKKRLRRRFVIREKKRGKRQEIVVNYSIQAVLEEYIHAYPDITVNPRHFVFSIPKPAIIFNPSSEDKPGSS
jgi:hypothetical protein